VKAKDPALVAEIRNGAEWNHPEQRAEEHRTPITRAPMSFSFLRSGSFAMVLTLTRHLV
jgi:hypothetical protein